MLRPYQSEACNAIISWVRKFTAPCLIEAATGAGKSHIIAEIADAVHRMSGGKKILCLAPSAELVIQNSEKYGKTGNPFSIYSASAGKKHLRHPVVFGTPKTVINTIEKFGADFAMVIVDECHGITPTVKDIIKNINRQNPNLRVVGMTATPYRMGSGYIFRQWPDGNPVPEHETRHPYFASCVYRITAHQLIGQGYLTPPVVGAIGGEHYDTLHMRVNNRGQFDAADVDRAYIGHGRKTSKIIEDIIEQARDRRGVMIFAATVRHAHECLASLPQELSAIITGDTANRERAAIIARFKAKQIKYLVNVDVLTTGFDAPHVDVIAMLRATESPGLLQQIIGRGLRLDEGKENCLILDYAQNLERHSPDGNIFSPTIRPMGKQSVGQTIKCRCPDCNRENEFTARPNTDGFRVDGNGYFCDLDFKRISTEFGDMPAHYGRRCQSWLDAGHGQLEQCRYRWTYKKCEKCDSENDIAARYCFECKTELVDPNEKLRIEFQEKKKDPTRLQTDRVLAWNVRSTISKAGKAVKKIDVTTPYRTFSFWISLEPTWGKLANDKAMFDSLRGQKPTTITYQKKQDGWFQVYGYNRSEDEIPA
jgi:DNA repair protein RadD